MDDDVLKRAANWLMGDDTGASSKALASKLMGADRKHFDHPHDPSDFGRCHRLMQAVPEFRSRLHEMSTCGPYWKALVARWDEIEAWYVEETAEGPHADQTYKLMKSILDPIRREDKNVVELSPGVTMRFGE